MPMHQYRRKEGRESQLPPASSATAQARKKPESVPLSTEYGLGRQAAALTEELRHWQLSAATERGSTGGRAPAGRPADGFTRHAGCGRRRSGGAPPGSARATGSTAAAAVRAVRAVPALGRGARRVRCMDAFM